MGTVHITCLRILHWSIGVCQPLRRESPLHPWRRRLRMLHGISCDITSCALPVTSSWWFWCKGSVGERQSVWQLASPPPHHYHHNHLPPAVLLQQLSAFSLTNDDSIAESLQAVGWLERWESRDCRNPRTDRIGCRCRTGVLWEAPTWKLAKPLRFQSFPPSVYNTWLYFCSVWMYKYPWECSYVLARLYIIQVLLEELFISTNYNLRMGSRFFFSLNLHQVFFFSF